MAPLIEGSSLSEDEVDQLVVREFDKMDIPETIKEIMSMPESLVRQCISQEEHLTDKAWTALNAIEGVDVT